jgi:antitoxin component YwqK of YwqJK toxin-antitoxin module
MWLLLLLLAFTRTMMPECTGLDERHERGSDGSSTAWCETLSVSGDWLYEGPRRVWYPNGQLAEEQIYKQGKKHGRYRHFFINGQLGEAGHYYYDRKDGLWAKWSVTGVPLSANHYQDGVLDGASATWFPNGQLAMQGSYTSGKHHGFWETFWPSGKKHQQGQFVGGMREGTWSEWNERGEVTITKWEAGLCVTVGQCPTEAIQPSLD